MIKHRWAPLNHCLTTFLITTHPQISTGIPELLNRSPPEPPTEFCCLLCCAEHQKRRDMLKRAVYLVALVFLFSLESMLTCLWSHIQLQWTISFKTFWTNLRICIITKRKSYLLTLYRAFSLPYSLCIRLIPSKKTFAPSLMANEITVDNF